MAKKKAAKKKAVTKKKATKKTARKKAASGRGPDLSRPRRFELESASSAKFWTISLEENLQTVQYGRLGTLGQTKRKDFDNWDLAEASYHKLIDEKLKKGYEEQIPATAAEIRREKKLHDPFLKEILADPDDPGPYAVYADWLTERGDPRGEFIHIQLQLEDENLRTADRKELQKREKQLLSRYQEKWLGDYSPMLMKNAIVRDYERYTRGLSPNFTYRFERGFLASLHVIRLFVPVSRMIRDAAETRFLRELIIESVEGEPDPTGDEDEYELSRFEPGDDVPTWEKDRISEISAHPLIGTKEFTSLHTFQVGGVGEDDIRERFQRHNHSADCHCYCNPALDIIKKMPRLRRLHLYCKEFDIHGLFKSKKLKHLEALEIYHLGSRGADRRERKQYEFPLELLAKNKTFSNLRELAFHPHTREYHRTEDYPSFLPLEQVRTLLRSQNLPKLERLQLRLSNMGDEGCQEIVDSGILKQLKKLDLRHGRITDEGVRILTECPDLKNLEFLDLVRNGIGKDGERLLRRSKVKFDASNQLNRRQFDEQDYLLDGDGE